MRERGGTCEALHLGTCGNIGEYDTATRCEQHVFCSRTRDLARQSACVRLHRVGADDVTLSSDARAQLDDLLDTLHQILPTVAPSATRVQMPSQERRVLYQMELECEVEEALSPRMVIITQPSDNLAQQHGRGEKFLRQRHWELDQGLVFVQESRGAQNQLPSLGPRGDMFERGRGGGIDCALP